MQNHTAELQRKTIEVIERFAANELRPDQLGPSTRLIDDLGVNSARMIDIILELEDLFGIQIEDESADHVKTIGDVITVIQHKLDSKQEQKGGV